MSTSEDIQEPDDELEPAKIKDMWDEISQIKDKAIMLYLDDAVRFIRDIQREVTDIILSKKLIQENSL